MGIPSYYRTLVSKIPSAITRSAPSSVSALLVDMNCMIYHILKEPKMSNIPYPGQPGSPESNQWETKLQDEVCKYLTHVWRCAGTPTQVYVALDGVVPYAKIKQQRFRRFKSAAASNATTATATWDTNAITPGTAFMAAMGNALRAAGSKFGWTISDTDETGEGEHKVMKWLQVNSGKLAPGPIVVYGLDADLILLCLLAGERLGDAYKMYLLRESMAFGKLVRPSQSEHADLCFFGIAALLSSLQNRETWSREQFYDYIFGMSFCGNDFLPTGLSLRMRDNGHAILLSCLTTLWKRDTHLVKFEDGIAVPDKAGLIHFTKFMLAQEERLVLTTIKGKMSARHGESAEDNLPLIEQAERPLIESGPNHQDGSSGGGLRLKRGWQKIYSRLALGSDDREHRSRCATEFWQGWCWILRYYQGLPVDFEWVYSAGYPPTWSDLLERLTSDTDFNGTMEIKERVPLKPQEQLALVLPMRSWYLLMKSPYRNLPATLPQFWPQGFHLETFGKRFGWECEPLIPMLTPERLRYEMRSNDTTMNRTT
jgi:5'-3' exonuclease